MQKEKEEKGKREAEEALRENGKADKQGKVEHEKVEEEASTENQPTESTLDDIIGNVEDSSSKEVSLVVFNCPFRCLYIVHFASSGCVFLLSLSLSPQMAYVLLIEPQMLVYHSFILCYTMTGLNSVM